MDLILRNGSIVTHAEEFIADIGIEGGKIKQIGQELGPVGKEIDVVVTHRRRSGRLILIMKHPLAIFPKIATD